MLCSICLSDIEFPLTQQEKSQRLSLGLPANKKDHENIKKYKKLCCNHYFHKECIDKWLNYSNRCPNCRRQVYNRIYMRPRLIIRVIRFENSISTFYY